MSTIPPWKLFVRTHVVFEELPQFSQKQINLWEDKRPKKKSKQEYLVSGPFSEAKGSQDLKLLNSPPAPYGYRFLRESCRNVSSN